MKFDFAIGNPPYMLTRETTKDMPIYNLFMDASYEIADKVELITPAKFLFNAGATPEKWNEKMLNDEHFKILRYESDCTKIFSNTSINGGVLISYRDNERTFKPIELFTPFEELNSIYSKIKDSPDFSSLYSIMFPYSSYTLSESLWEDFPEKKKKVEYISKNRNKLTKEEKEGELSNFRILTSNIFDLLEDLFFSSKPTDGKEYCCIMGRRNNERCNMYILKKYIDVAANYDKYKVFMSGADGAAGSIGNPIPARISGKPFIVGPGTGHTQTFQSIGSFNSEDEANSLKKYLCTKFARTALGILKRTQHYPPAKWKYVPLQDFTSDSDINWNVSIRDIDRQLYKKYLLSEEEINFIETHIKEME